MGASFPRPVTDFLHRIPHRPPFVWIDEVLAVSAAGGSAGLTLKPGALYFGPQGLRRSSFLEFMAQAFGYIRVAQAEAGFLDGRPTPTKAFLVSIQDGVYADESVLGPPPGTRLTVEVGAIREIGPITLFSAAVHDLAGVPLAGARLKVFSE
jgi:hypothetical protein